MFNQNQTQDTGNSLPAKSPSPVQEEETLKQPAVVTPAVAVETPVAAEIVSAEVLNEEEVQPAEDLPLAHESEQFSTIKRSPHSKTNSLQSQSPDETTSSNETDTAVYKEEEEVRTKVSVTVQQSQSTKTSGLSTLERNACKLKVLEMLRFSKLTCVSFLFSNGSG